jgi:Phage ABA sandwich domain
LRIEFDSMPAGLEMDQLIAEKVTGGAPTAETPLVRWLKENGDFDHSWSPSQQDSAAYEVIAAAWARFGLVFAHEKDQNGHVAYFASSPENESAVKAVSRAETFALAVCRAALKAAQSR